jgi:hypothetical protein
VKSCPVLAVVVAHRMLLRHSRRRPPRKRPWGPQ